MLVFKIGLVNLWKRLMLTRDFILKWEQTKASRLRDFFVCVWISHKRNFNATKSLSHSLRNKKMNLFFFIFYIRFHLWNKTTINWTLIQKLSHLLCQIESISVIRWVLIWFICMHQRTWINAVIWLWITSHFQFNLSITFAEKCQCVIKINLFGCVGLGSQKTKIRKW